jgi:hypothetical protein
MERKKNPNELMPLTTLLMMMMPLFLAATGGCG